MAVRGRLLADGGREDLATADDDGRCWCGRRRHWRGCGFNNCGPFKAGADNGRGKPPAEAAAPPHGRSDAVLCAGMRFLRWL